LPRRPKRIQFFSSLAAHYRDIHRTLFDMPEGNRKDKKYSCKLAGHSPCRPQKIASQVRNKQLSIMILGEQKEDRAQPKDVNDFGKEGSDSSAAF